MNTLSSLITRCIQPASEKEILSVENRIFIRFFVPTIFCLGAFNLLFFPNVGVSFIHALCDTGVYFVFALVLYLAGSLRLSEEQRGFFVELTMTAFLFFVMEEYYPLIKTVVWTISAIFILLSMCRIGNRMLGMILATLFGATAFIVYKYRVALDVAQIVTQSVAFAGLAGCTVFIKKIGEGRARELIRKRQEVLELLERLQATDKNKNTFLSTLSHELRNPLATLNAGMTLMDIGCCPEIMEETREIMKSEVKQLTNLVDDLLDVTRIVTNKVSLKKETVCLNDICLTRAHAFILLYAEKCVGLDIRIPDDPVYIHADPVRISQIVGNLLDNALKFTEEGRGNVRLEMHAENNEAVLCVSDNGIGIAPHVIPSIFELFVQGDAPGERPNCGLGLGLPIVRAMTERHGGRVQAISDGTGKGAVFIIYLPLMTEDDVSSEGSST